MAQTPETHALDQDPFSRVLDLLRLRGTSVATGAVSGGGRLDYADSGPCLYVFQHSGLSFGQDGTRHEVRSGDVVLMVRGGPHQVACAAVGGDPVPFIRGEFDFDSVFAARFLGTLPAVITLERSGQDRHEWVDVCCAFMAFEAAHGLAGSTAMISRLLDLLFIRTLRSWASASALGQGWVSSASDPRIGRVLAAMQAGPAEAWTLQALASIAGMSRTAFASRFVQVIGQTPVAYLNHWRLDLAADVLRGQSRAAGPLYAQVGYTSEAAFGRAFKLRHGKAPQQWRRAQAPT